MLQASKNDGTINAFASSARFNGKNMKSLLEDFVQTCKKNNIVKLSEGAETVDSYYNSFLNISNK